MGMTDMANLGGDSAEAEAARTAFLDELFGTVPGPADVDAPVNMVTRGVMAVAIGNYRRDRDTD